MAKKPHKVLVDGPVAGKARKKGDVVELTAKQARYEHVAPVEDPTPSRVTAPETEAKPRKGRSSK